MSAAGEPERARELQEDRATAVWVARLRSGGVAYMDDHPSEDPPSAWLRLRRRLREEGDSVVGLSLKFRSRVESPLPENAPGYFFANAARCEFGGDTQRYALIGYVEGDEIVVHRYLTPELIAFSVERRPLEDTPCLIR